MARDSTFYFLARGQDFTPRTFHSLHSMILSPAYGLDVSCKTFRLLIMVTAARCRDKREIPHQREGTSDVWGIARDISPLMILRNASMPSPATPLLNKKQEIKDMYEVAMTISAATRSQGSEFGHHESHHPEIHRGIPNWIPSITNTNST